MTPGAKSFELAGLFSAADAGAFYVSGGGRGRGRANGGRHVRGSLAGSGDGDGRDVRADTGQTVALSRTQFRGREAASGQYDQWVIAD